MSLVEKIPSFSAAGDGAPLYYEARVAEALGIPRKLLAKLRAKHLVPGTDFVRAEANAIALTATGLAAIESALAAGDEGTAVLRGENGRETTGKPPSRGKPAPDLPAGPPPREVMTVDRVPQNPNILLCQRRSPACIVAVRVRANEFFAPGMKIECIQGGGVWQFRNRVPGHESQCGRLPRRKGVW